MASRSHLLGAYAAILAELRTRGVVRTNNAPVGDYAETLVVAALGGSLAESVSEKSYGSIVHMTSELFGQPGAVDVTTELQTAADEM